MTRSEREAKKRIRRHITNLRSPDKKVATRAEDSLIRYYGVRAFDELVEACGDPNPEVRFRAVWALAYTKLPEAYETILALVHDPEDRVMFDAAVAPLASMAIPELLRFSMLSGRPKREAWRQEWVLANLVWPPFRRLRRRSLAAIPSKG